jgi:gamma-glutamyl phosphate reductase
MSTTNGLSSAPEETALAAKAKEASLILGALSLTQRNWALQKIHDALLAKKDEILSANKVDMQVHSPTNGAPLMNRQQKN